MMRLVAGSDLAIGTTIAMVGTQRGHDAVSEKPLPLLPEASRITGTTLNVSGGR